MVGIFGRGLLFRGLAQKVLVLVVEELRHPVLLLLGQARESHIHARPEFVPVLDGEEFLPTLQAQLLRAQSGKLPEELDEMLGRTHASLTPRSRRTPD